MDTYDVHGPNPFPRGDARSNVIEVKETTPNPRREGPRQYEDGGARTYHGDLASGFLAARDNGPESRPTGLADAGRSNPSQWTPVNPAGLVERPRQVYDTTLGADIRTSAFARGQRAENWTTEDAYLTQFTQGTMPAHGVYEVQPSGQGGRRRNEAEIDGR
jgi:hypothetical protein